MLLVRYGQVPEVARFTSDLPQTPARGDYVVVRTHRGRQLGEVLQILKSTADETDFTVEAICDAAQRAEIAQLQQQAAGEFASWQARIQQWNLALELIDLERTIDGEKLILYVLSDRGPDCTKLALQAAAAGLGTVEVQPVSATGLVALPSAGGCGSGGGGCGSCG